MKTQKLIFAFWLLLSISSFSPVTVSAKDEWTRVRSKNFNLIGNADEKNIRAVGVRLEQFREALREVLDKFNFDSPVPTTVVVFRDAAAYQPYKPVKSGGETNNIAVGYFLPGEDVNYITLAAAVDAPESYNTIFHEYTHFLIRNNLGESSIPPWYNEGLAEYYETFTVESDRKITLGGAQAKSAALLSRNGLIPFDAFFATGNYALHERGADAVGLFYAQAWALTHYLIHGGGGRRAQLDKFLNLVMANKPPRAAFTEAFGVDYAAMEIELKKYVAQNVYPATSVVLKNKLSDYAEMQSLPLTEAEAEAYLGDLLYHSNRLAEAETHLDNALKLHPNLGAALNTLGLLKMRRFDFIDARKHLEKAVETDAANYLTHYNYAYVLSREAMTEFGFVSEYDRETAEKMRQSLRRAIELNPGFAESYNLFAFIGMVRNETLDEAIEYLNKALKIAPGNQWYLIHLAELYMRKEKFADARALAVKVAQTARDEQLKVYSQNTLRLIDSTESAYKSIKNRKKRLPEDDVLDQILTDEEFARLRAVRILESLNRALYKPKAGEKRILGHLTAVACREREMIYTVKVGDEIIKLSSASFYTVNLTAHNPAMASWQIGCGEIKNQSLAVVNYRSATNAESKIAGEVVSIEFVPDDFKFLDANVRNPTN